MGCKVLFVVKEIEGAEPLGALYVAGSLMRAGHTCRFVGTRGHDVLAAVRNFAPDVVACGATTGLHRYYLGLLYEVKRRFPRVMTLMGGPHPTFFPEAIQNPALDVICRGEGETAAVELCDAIAAGADYRYVRDLWVKWDGQIFRNPPRPLCRDLDAISSPPRKLLYAYDDSLRMRSLKSFTANRGCPFPCSYCFNQSLADHYGPTWKKVRVRSPENIVAEISAVQSEGPLKIIGFRESIFAYTTDWLREFGALYRSEVGLPYYCHVRADLLTEEMVELLAESGCHSVNLGIETANPELANAVLNRRIRFDRMIEGIKRLKRAGIVVFSDNILGIPGGTLEDDLATLQLNIDLEIDYAAATLCTPYPGTAIEVYAKTHGYFDGDFDEIAESYYSSSVFRFGSDSEKRQIENLHKLFALTAAAPRLLPLVKWLIKLPPNDFFYSAFRAWYVISHMTEVMPRLPNWKQLKEAVQSIFGIYRGNDPNRYGMPTPTSLPYVDAGSEAPTTAQSPESVNVA